MTSTDNNDESFRITAKFLSDYFGLLALQIKSCREIMTKAVEGVMNEVKEISDFADKKKEQANDVIFDCYINPDANSSEIIEDMQKEVSKIFDAASGENSLKASVPNKIENTHLSTSDTSAVRKYGLFAKKLEALSNADGDIGNHVLSIIGLLSADDVVSQRLEHVILTLSKSQEIIDRLLRHEDPLNFSTKIQNEISALHSYMFKIYTTEEEKKVHHAIFNKLKNAS